jgi:hypothetical protein
MAKTIVKIRTGLNIKFLKRPKKYYLLKGNQHIVLEDHNGTSFTPKGFDSIEECKAFGNKLVNTGFYNNQFVFTYAP